MSDKQMHTYLGMGYVRENYTPSGLTDTLFAVQMNEVPELDGHTFSHAHVRQFRQSLKIPNNQPRNNDSAKVKKKKKLFEALLLHCEADLREGVGPRARDA
jgi:hypothetical protein